MEAITCDVSGLGASFNPAQATRSKGIVSKSAVTHPPRRAAIVVLSLAVAVPAVALASKRATLPAVEDDALVVHALNRLGYGPRPGAVYSERQLDEVMVDFWMNHFNVFAGKGPVKFMIGEYERDVVRPRAWGRFEDLLRATAESPAMLFYLDNWLSADPNAQPMGFRARGRRGRFFAPPPAPGQGQGHARKR